MLMKKYENRELSWLKFNVRVLEEALDHDHPILERMKFLSISASNLDEFFMVRVAGLKEQVSNKYKKEDPCGLTPKEQLREVVERSHEFMARQYSCYNRSILPALRKNNIFILKPEELTPAQTAFVSKYFDQVIYPVVTPLAIDSSRPFPLLLNKSLNIALRLHDGKSKFALVQVPSILPRFLELPCDEGHAFILLENAIVMKLHVLFDPVKIAAVCPFRITRNSDLAIDEDSEDLLRAIEKSIKDRKRGKPVRLEINPKSDKETRAFLIEELDVAASDIVEQNGPLDLTFCMKFSGLPGFDHLREQPIQPAVPADFRDVEDVFEAIRQRDRLVHHPYESFDCVIRFIQTAANDPDVLAIKQTLYRVSGHSPVIGALIRAAEQGKQVTVLVELKARFDEENNIQWAKKLENAGCHVIYGVPGLKTHCKMLLVVRREHGEIRRYVHMSTGNYNDSTSRLYTDIGMFTCKTAFGSDASALFNMLTGFSKPPEWKKLLVAPTDMRIGLIQCIDKEIELAKQGVPAKIVIKVNSLVDIQMIDKLYEASKAGVKITLVVRGICCLRAGVPELSENITVLSIVGKLLEHSRIFYFENGGQSKIFMGSADLMPRNLDRRVETIFPVEEPVLKERIFEILEIITSDTIKARVMLEDGQYARIDKRGKALINSQALLEVKAL